MLFYKLWRESRARFFFTLITILIVTIGSVLYNPSSERIVVEAKDFHLAAFRTFRGPMFLFWGFAAVFLGLGGLLRERALGTIDYTLSLPASRAQWFLSRAAVGASQAALVALIPSLFVPLIAQLAGGSYPLSEAALHGSLLALGGMLFFSIGLLMSTIFNGEFASAGVGIAMVFLINNGTRVIQALKPFNVQDIVAPTQIINKATYLIEGHLPWLGISGSLALSIVLFAAAWKITEYRDF